jgi:hypothetical protein
MAHRIICRAQWICLISVLLGFPATASAQTGDGMIIFAIFLQQLNKVADLSAGFSMARGTNTPGSERVIPIGLQFGTTIDVHKSLGIDADLAVQSGKPAGSSELFNMFEYLFGPRFSARTRRATVFGHILAGGVKHWQDSPGYEQPATFKGGGFAMAFGGGFDVNVSERIAIRVAQVDWIPIREDGCWINNTVRFGFGIVFRLAK